MKLKNSVKACVLLLAVVVSGRFVRAEVAGGQEVAAAVGVLEERLVLVRQDLDAAREEAAQENVRYLQYEHDIAYTNAALMTVYQEMKRVEKQLVEKRKEFQEALRKLPETRRMTEAREAKFKRVRELRDQESTLMKEIHAVRMRALDKKQKL